MADKTGAATCDPGRLSRLTQILAWKAGRDHVDCRQLPKLGDVAYTLDLGEPGGEHSLSGRVPLAQELGAMTGLVESELDAANAGEQTCDRKRSPRMHRSQSSIALGQVYEQRFGRLDAGT